MILGKRQRPPMKRTTSMRDITLDLNANGEVVAHPYQPTDPHNPLGTASATAGGWDQRFLSSTTLSTKPARRNSSDFIGTPHFLRACFLCKRRLFPGRDIFMYRGDSAFCSQECRQYQMTLDERKAKCSLAASKKGAASTTSETQVSVTGETVAAV